MDLPPPFILGLPDKFEEWRNGQDEAVSFVAEAPTRFIGLCCPTGFGKSLAYIAAALADGGRVAVLTMKKGLQDQLVEDFGAVGLTDVRGMNSYPCLAADHYKLPRRTTCAEGPCHAGAPCNLKDGGCHYYDALRRALASNLVVTNYSFWMHSYRYGEGLGSFDLLVLDEAHDAPEAVSSFVGVVLDNAELGSLLDDGRTPEPSAPVRDWTAWGRDQYLKCDTRIKLVGDRIKDSLSRGLDLHPSYFSRLLKLKQLLRNLECVATMVGEWAIERSGTRFVRLDPVWPGVYAERYLFKGISRVALFSATIRPKTAELLGITKSELSFREWPSTFPLPRRPVIYVPTISVRHTASDMEMRSWVTRIDQIIRQRLDRKGIIHVTSYARRDLLVGNSEFRRIMLWHGSADTAEVVARFKHSHSPAILVSPSLTTGWDFPYQECEYAIIAKVPFPDFTTELARARDRTDANWSKYATMQILVQTSGRGMRAEDDSCEVLAVDDNIAWFVRQFAHYAPKWWLDAYRQSATIPTPLPLLQHR